MGKKMKTVILGQNIVRTWELVANKSDEGKYLNKPYLRNQNECTYTDLFEFKGEINYNLTNTYFDFATFNISEDETVKLIKKIFRADLNKTFIYTDHIVSEKDINKDDLEIKLDCELKLYNEQLIKNDEKILKYCTVHNLDISIADYEYLKKLVYGDINIGHVSIGNMATLSNANSISLINNNAGFYSTDISTCT